LAVRCSAAVRARRLARVAGGGRLAEQRTTLALVWPNVMERVGPHVAGDQTVRAQLPADLPPLVGSGEIWVEILTELVENGLEATPGGGVVTLRAEAVTDGRVRVAVEDNGRGIGPEVLPHVMEPFYTSRGGVGAEGLGLAMVASMVEAVGGTMRLASKPGEGTTVEMEVPAARPAPVISFAGTVLVADDDQRTREGMARLLESFGCTPVQCDSGTVARRLLVSEPKRFRLAVLDVVMPGTPVEEVVRAAREQAPDLPILFVSGYDTMRHVDGVLSGGGVRFLRKPFTRQAFHEALGDLLAEPAVPGAGGPPAASPTGGP
jgi:CheY-like chemotaxis protein/anti-sigma regulatory factor (Ser/Thr protein kinase)